MNRMGVGRLWHKQIINRNPSQLPDNYPHNHRWKMQKRKHQRNHLCHLYHWKGLHNQKLKAQRSVLGQFNYLEKVVKTKLRLIKSNFHLNIQNVGSTVWSVQRTSAIFSANQIQNGHQSQLSHLRLLLFMLLTCFDLVAWQIFYFEYLGYLASSTSLQMSSLLLCW